jgi:hypothetical protein
MMDACYGHLCRPVYICQKPFQSDLALQILESDSGNRRDGRRVDILEYAIEEKSRATRRAISKRYQVQSYE